MGKRTSFATLAAILALAGATPAAAAERQITVAPGERLHVEVAGAGTPVVLEQRSADPRWVTDAVVAGYMAAGARDLDGTLTALRQIAKAREPEPLRPRLSEVPCPVRLVIGTAAHEGGISPAEIALLQERLARFSIDRVEDAGHFVFEEKPEAVVAAIRTAAAAGRPRRADGSGR